MKRFWMSLLLLPLPVLCVALAFRLTEAESAAPNNNWKIVAKELTVETVHIKHPNSKYTLTLAARPNGAWLKIGDGAGRTLTLSINEHDNGLAIYQKGGKHLVGLGQHGGDDPMLAITDPDTENASGFAYFPAGRVGIEVGSKAKMNCRACEGDCCDGDGPCPADCKGCYPCKPTAAAKPKAKGASDPRRHSTLEDAYEKDCPVCHGRGYTVDPNQTFGYEGPKARTCTNCNGTGKVNAR